MNPKDSPDQNQMQPSSHVSGSNDDVEMIDYQIKTEELNFKDIMIKVRREEIPEYYILYFEGKECGFARR